MQVTASGFIRRWCKKIQPHRLNGLIFSNYLRLPLNMYIFLVKQLEKHPHLAPLQFHPAAHQKNEKNIVAIISKKDFFYAHRQLSLCFRPTSCNLNDKLKKRIRLVNTYNAVLHKILLCLLRKQKAYFKSGNIHDLKPLAQKEAADRLKVNASWIHYIISAKNILTPKGEILPLRTLFFSKKKWVQLRIEAILNRESRNKPYTDQEIRREIFLKYGRSISLRGICGYRHSLHIPAWYQRKKRKDVSCRIDFSPEYLLTRKNYQKYAPSKAGIYVFKKGGKCFYIGSSGNLRKRIRTHLYNGSKNKKLSEYICSNRCVFQYALRDKDWKMAERKLYLDFIKTHRAPPFFNKMRP